MIAVFRSRNGNVYATQASCPHRNGPLADGLLGGSTIVCPLHARKFDLETGKSQSDDCFLRTYSIYLADNGHLILNFDAAELPT
ncbi:Nitrite reductase [NAD(P)H] small subunit [Fimbriimonas ginsengisoli Gsoil 348]|uniref:Nitrite reductase [NAD(P)H] small subunit n=2 Tax=Fimbriimonas ginsengisoli TaxID=1005039 RepID=A0A068NLL4_FIMGI|nr:Nitrite reductase [NAD(P)H] small subunit [Fimbriimonas ginsengisoli Gsoil 348]